VGNGLDRRSPQGLSGVVAVRSQASPPVCLSLVGTGQPPSLSGSSRQLLSDLRIVERCRYAPPCPAIVIRRAARLQTLTIIVRARDSRDCSNQASCMQRAFPIIHSTRNVALFGPVCPCLRQRHHPTIICGAADQAHLTAHPDLTVPHECKNVGE
jgi:hypothetical protein